MPEQAAGFAAEAYYKVKNIPGVAIATSEPGGQILSHLLLTVSMTQCLVFLLPAS